MRHALRVRDGDRVGAWRETIGPWHSCRSPLFYAVWGTDEHDVWAVGAGGMIVKLDDEVLVDGETCRLPEGGEWGYRH